MKLRLPLVACMALVLSGPMTARAQSGRVPSAPKSPPVTAPAPVGGVSVVLTPPPVSAVYPGLPPPPADAMARRLLIEAEIAGATADQLQAARDQPNADFQREIQQRRLYQAAQKYSEVGSSATYGGTPYAASAIFHQAETLEKLAALRPRKDPNPGIQVYKTLLGQRYADMNYAEKPLLMPELKRLEQLADYQNRTFIPERYIYGIIDFFVKLTGSRPYSYFLALLFISVLAKLAMWPLANKQYKAMKQMQKLQPVMKEIQTKYKGDPQKMQIKMMELYKEHDAHPLKGCGPTLLSLPIWWAVYYMVRLYEFQFSHGQFLWIGSALSHTHLNIMGLDLSPALNLSLVDIPLLLFYGLTMYLQQKMMPMNPDPQQAEQQKMMMWMAPLMSTYFFLQYRMPSAFVLYFLISNLLSMGQQAYQNRNMDGGSGSSSGGKPILTAPMPPESPGPQNGNGRGNPYMSGNGASSNGAEPAARGAISPKIHAKKKRR